MKKRCPRYRRAVMDLIEQIDSLCDTVRNMTAREAESAGKALERIYAYGLLSDEVQPPGTRDWTLAEVDLTEGVRLALQTFGYHWKSPKEIEEEVCTED